MIISAVRYRNHNAAPWRAWRFGSSIGRYQSDLCFQSDETDCEDLIAAMLFALGGKTSPRIAEASVQISDDAGDSWLIHCSQGDRWMTKNGVLLDPVEAESQFRSAIKDADLFERGEGASAALPFVNAHRIFWKNGEFKVEPYGRRRDRSQSESLKEVIDKQLHEIANGFRQCFVESNLEDPKTINALTRKLEPLLFRYQEICLQIEQVAADEKSLEDGHPQTINQLAEEVEISEKIDEIARPMLTPGASLKSLRDALKETEAKLASLCKNCGLETSEFLHTGPRNEALPDWRKPLEALSKLELYSKLVRASQAARTYCEQNVEPVFEQYLEVIEQNITRDRQVSNELEGCLSSLALKLKEDLAPASYGQTKSPKQQSIKTWFDRFKAEKIDETQNSDNTRHDRIHELEAARMAIEYVLDRFSELAGHMAEIREDHVSAMVAMDQVHSALTEHHKRLREHWASVAREFHLPTDLSLPQLITIIISHASLHTAWQKRLQLQEAVRNYSTDLAKLQTLVSGWRRISNSQKEGSLSNPGILLTEARDIIRYLGPKRKKLESLRAKSEENRTRFAIAAVLKQRKEQILEQWRHAFSTCDTPPLSMDDERLVELFERARLIRALALIQRSIGETKANRLFAEDHQAAILSIYFWDTSGLDNKQRLDFMRLLEEAPALGTGQLRMVLVPDEPLARMLESMGVAQALPILSQDKDVALPGSKTGPKSPTPGPGLFHSSKVSVEPPRATRPPPRPTAPPPGKRQNIASSTNASPLISDRAKAALDLLTRGGTSG